MTQSTLSEEGFLRLPAVLALYPVSRSSWWAGVAAGKYPRGYKLGARVTAWRTGDIRELLEKSAASQAIA